MGNFPKKEIEGDGARGLIVKELFLKTMADVHFIKFSAVSSLGSIASTLVNTDCKLLVLQLGTVMNGQILRLKLIASLLASNGIFWEPPTRPHDEVINYLRASDQDGSEAKDAIILSRFLIINCTEISSFKLLIKLAPVLKTKMVGHHLKVCMTEATAEKAILETKLATYI